MYHKRALHSLLGGFWENRHFTGECVTLRLAFVDAQSWPIGATAVFPHAEYEKYRQQLRQFIDSSFVQLFSPPAVQLL